MHIPDGYLSPATCAAAGAAAAPACALAARKLKRDLKDREAPLLAAGAAFCFAVMMLNVPIPDGTTAHAVGGTLIAIVLGPAAAVLALAVALTVQAFFFGDGGVLALGANCLNMAVILPLSGYAVYRALAPASSRFCIPRPAAAACGAYVGINLAALAAAIELGIQPALYHTPAGTPIYCPYHLSQTIPAMLLAHLTVAGGVEAAVTGMVIAYVLKAQPALLDEPGTPASHTWAWRGLAILVVLSPLGLLAPGSAFGEASAEELRKLLGYTPIGLQRLGGFWNHVPLPDYNLPGISGVSVSAQAPGYWLSAMVGAVGVVLVIKLLLALICRRSSPTYHSPLTGAPQGVPPAPLTTHHPSTPRPNDPTTHPIPDWLLMHQSSSNCQCIGRQQRPSYVEKTLLDMSRFVGETLFAETVARQPGFLQQRDPRAKVLVLGVLLVTACSLQRLSLLAMLLALALAVAVATRVPLDLLYRRLAVLPVFTALAAIPAIFNWVTPGVPLLLVARWDHPLTMGPFSAPSTLSITLQGVLGVLILVTRVATSISLVALLTITTRWNDLLKALRSLLAPRLFVLVLAMVYRYLFLLLQTAADMFEARKSRTVGQESPAEGRQFVASTIGSLLAKTQDLSEEVYAAMLSRGYRGEPVLLSRWKLTTWDYWWGAAGVCTAVAFWLGDRALG